MIRKIATVVNLKSLSWHVRADTEENHETFGQDSHLSVRNLNWVLQIGPVEKKRKFQWNAFHGIVRVDETRFGHIFLEKNNKIPARIMCVPLCSASPFLKFYTILLLICLFNYAMKNKEHEV